MAVKTRTELNKGFKAFGRVINRVNHEVFKSNASL